MNYTVINQIIKQSPHLSWMRRGTVYLTRHGSYAYGTNIETSDEDFKGIAIPTKQYFLGSANRFEQAELKDPDTAVYEIRKFFNLAVASNPSVIEVLFTDPSDHIIVDPIGEIILDHRNDFLSKRIRHSFGGYAWSQLSRIKLHRQYLLNPPQNKPTRKAMGLPEQTLIPQDQLMAAEAEIQKELDKCNFDFMDGLDEPTKIGIRNIMTNMLAELKIASEDHWMAAARKVGLSDNFIEIMQKERAYTNSKREWDKYQEWKTNRNPERAAMEAKFGFDGKFGMHLYRLLLMCKEILTTGNVIVKRKDREEILAIRRGYWSYDRLIEFADKSEKELDELYKTTNVLPKSPDMNKIDQLCIELVEKSLSKYSWYSVKKQFSQLLP